MPHKVLAATGLPVQAFQQHRLSSRSDLTIEFHSPRRNVTLDLEAFEREIGVSVGPLASDLVELAAVVLMADLACRRGRNEHWTRQFEILVPMRQPDAWEAQRPHIEAMLGFLTGDNIRLTFVARDSTNNKPSTIVRTSLAPPDCIALLSGGLDSLAGALLLLAAGRRPLFVMHRDLNPRVAAAQRHVISIVNARGASGVARISLHPSGVHRPRHPFPRDGEREPSQRSRSFFFLAAAVAAAEALGLREIFLFENGIIARNIPLSPARIGSLSTRTTHPRFVQAFSNLANGLFGGTWTIANPFLSRTKGEIVAQVLAPELSPGDLRATVSCWQAGRAARPCGGCVPCILRRLAFVQAGVGDEATMQDILAEPLAYKHTEAFGNLVDILWLCAQVREGTKTDLVCAFPALVNDAGGIGDTIALLRRFGAEVDSVLAQHFKAAWKLSGIVQPAKRKTPQGS